MRGRLIVFSGIDGAGKSTQIERVAELLATTNRKPTVLWTRGGYTSGMNFTKSLLRRASGKFRSRQQILPPSGPSQERTRAFSNPWVRKLWLTLSIVDLIRVYAVNVRWKLYCGGHVLCDRYHQDTLLDFQLHHPSETVHKWWLWRLLVALSPKPDAAFLLLVPTDVSKQRSVEKNEPFPTPDDILAARLEVYRTWPANDDTWHVVDGTHPVEQVSNAIRTNIRSRCPNLLPQNAAVA